MADAVTDAVNSPSHYKSHGCVEAIDVIEEYGLGLHLGNAAKYLLCAGKKGCWREDMGKARWYVVRWLDGMARGRHGVESPWASHRARGCVDWRRPNAVADLFGLAPHTRHRRALVALLTAGCCETREDAVEQVSAVRDLLDLALAPHDIGRMPEVVS